MIRCIKKRWIEQTALKNYGIFCQLKPKTRKEEILRFFFCILFVTKYFMIRWFKVSAYIALTLLGLIGILVSLGQYFFENEVKQYVN